MSRKTELIALLIADVVSISLAFLLLHYARFEWGWFDDPIERPPTLLVPTLVVSLYCLALFGFSGMYRERYASSRFDETVSLLQVTAVGVLILVFAIFIDTLEPGASRGTIFFYWAAVFGIVSLGRFVVRSVQKALILRGYGLHRALIVGWSDRVEQLFEEVARYPAAGLQIVGAVQMPREQRVPEPVSAGPEVLTRPGAYATQAVTEELLAGEEHSIEALPRLIDELDVQDVLIALGSEDHGPLMDVLRLCDGQDVSLKLIPDFYSVIGGMARTEHMYGLPLIEVLPVPMPAWEQSTKRLLDVVVSLIVLLSVLPLWIILGALVRLTSSGPAIYKQQRVGQHGRAFTMYKYRTMRHDAEAETGPVWAQAGDPRYTPLGRWLRRTRLDEVPQFWNVLRGDMSLVGPRPERPYFVERLADEIPLYSRRHRVKPGITGWAQVMWRYDQCLDDVRQKVKYDLFYIENMSLRMDFKILFRTIRTAVSGQGQ